MTAPPTREITQWFLKNQRRLPWRIQKDPYFVWVSEIMLQQTQVNTVVPYFERFTARFPKIQTLARAAEAEVFELWAGLGYYSRARNLHKGARLIVEKLGGQIPDNPESLLSIPGIGRYTAGAIASIAYGVRAPIVDGNVKRVFARWYGYTQSIDTPKASRFFWERAAEWVNTADAPSDLNQSVMELGATVCSKTNPLCDFCPIAQGCVGRRKGLTEQIPKRKVKRNAIRLRLLAAVYTRGESVFLVKQNRWWKGLWGLPMIELRECEEPESRLHDLASGDVAIHSLPRVSHAVTHHRITVYPYHLRIRHAQRLGDGQWFPVEKLPATSSLVRKIIEPNIGSAPRRYASTSVGL